MTFPQYQSQSPSLSSSPSSSPSLPPTPSSLVSPLPSLPSPSSCLRSHSRSPCLYNHHSHHSHHHHHNYHQCHDCNCRITLTSFPPHQDYHCHYPQCQRLHPPCCPPAAEKRGNWQFPGICKQQHSSTRMKGLSDIPSKTDLNPGLFTPSRLCSFTLAGRELMKRRLSLWDRWLNTSQRCRALHLH